MDSGKVDENDEKDSSLRSEGHCKACHSERSEESFDFNGEPSVGGLVHPGADGGDGDLHEHRDQQYAALDGVVDQRVQAREEMILSMMV